MQQRRGRLPCPFRNGEFTGTYVLQRVQAKEKGRSDELLHWTPVCVGDTAQQPMGPNQIPSGSWQRIRVLLAVDRLDRGVPQMNVPRSQMSAWCYGSAVAILIILIGTLGQQAREGSIPPPATPVRSRPRSRRDRCTGGKKRCCRPIERGLLTIGKKREYHTYQLLYSSRASAAHSIRVSFSEGPAFGERRACALSSRFPPALSFPVHGRPVSGRTGVRQAPVGGRSSGIPAVRPPPVA